LSQPAGKVTDSVDRFARLWGEICGGVEIPSWVQPAGGIITIFTGATGNDTRNGTLQIIYRIRVTN